MMEDILSSLDLIQLSVAGAFVLLQGFALLKSVYRRRASIVGTGGTIILPLLLLWLVFTLRIPFRFTGIYSVEIAGALLVLAGVLVKRWAAECMGENVDDFWVARRRNKTRALVTNGPYAVVRHPIYAGEFLLYGGLLLIFFHSFTAVLAALYALIIFTTAFYEERFLRGLFPGYGAYQKETGMLFPKWCRGSESN